MTPAEHAKAIEDAAVAYAEATHTQDSYGARHGLKAAIIAGVGAVPEGWQLVPVEPTNAMLDALEEGGCSEGNYKAALAAAPKP